MPCEVVPLRVDFSKMAAVAMETAKMLKKNEKHKNDHSRLLAKQILMKLGRNNIHMNKPNFMKLCRNIHRSVWKLLAC